MVPSSATRRVVVASPRGLALDDKLISCAVAFIGAFLLYGLDREGRQPLVNQLTAQASDAKDAHGKRLHLSISQCRELESTGYLVIDDFLSPRQLLAARQSMTYIHQRGEANERLPYDGILRMGTSSNEASVRTDRICWLGHAQRKHVGSNQEAQEIARSEEEGIQVVRLLMRSLAGAIQASDFQGFDDLNDDGNKENNVDHWWYTSRYPFLRRRFRDTTTSLYYQSKQSWLGVPEMVQLATYGVRMEKNTSFYLPHLGYIRSHYLRRRYITAIVYLNGATWNLTDGGHLRLHRHDETTVDISPMGGRLVLFSSANMIHEVRPTFRHRDALTLWITLN